MEEWGEGRTGGRGSAGGGGRWVEGRGVERWGE